MDPKRYIVQRGQLPPVPQLPRVAEPCKTFSQPPLDGTLCTSEIYEWHARHSPDHPVFQYHGDDGSVATIRYRDVIHAIYRGGWRLRGALGQEKLQGRRPIVAVIALSEYISYALTWLGAERAGITLFPISPRNSPAAVAHLLAQVGVDLVLVGREESMQELANASFERMRAAGVSVPPTAEMPTFGDLFPEDEQEVEPLPPMEYEAGDVNLIAHSSGSTAFPKPIRWTFFRMTAASRMCYYGDVNMTGMRIASHSLPMYHGMGVSQVLWAGSVGTIILCQRPMSPPRACSPAEMLHDAHALGCDLLNCTPNFVEAWAKSPEAVEKLKQTRGLMFGGGPLGKDSGDFLVSKGISLYAVYGCTEFGTVSTVLPSVEESLVDWEYFSFAKPVAVHWIHDENVPGTSRLVLMAGELCSPVVMNYEVDGVGGFDTNDLFTRHPTNPDLWRIYGRADDQIMHSIGEKTNPGPLEAILNLDTHVAHALMFGRGRFNAGVLIDPIPELKFDPKDEDKLVTYRNIVWPTVERMNHYAPQHSRIFKEMILVTSPHKPFTYTAKGAPRRHAIIEEYAPEIDALYTAVEESTQVDLPAPRCWDIEETRRFVRALVSKVLGRSLDDAQDLFQYGCDSLQATWIRNSLLHALRATSRTDTRSIPINFVYDNPSVSRLSEYLASVACSPEKQPNGITSPVQAMHDMLNKYSQDFPAHQPRAEANPVGDVVLVTGTTGGLGSALLSQLHHSPEVVKVYAINRRGKSPLVQRQREVLVERGYDADAILGSSKVVLLEADVAQSMAGLPPELYNEIRDSVTHVIHNAWPVNFNLNLEFFEPNIRGVRNLIDLALGSPLLAPPRLLFISSIGVLRRIDHSRPIREDFVDAAVAVGTGYSESKWVCERLLGLASQATPLPSISIRAGQIAGSDNGAWNVHEWVPSLIKSSIYLGCLPTLPSNVSWMNVSSFASAIIEARRAPAELSPLHLAHPRPVSWNTLFEPVRTKYNLPFVPYSDWFAKLAASADSTDANNAARDASQVDSQTPSDDSDTASRISASEVAASVELPAHVSQHGQIAETSSILAANPSLKLLSFFKACDDSIRASLQDGRPFEEAMGLPQLDVTKTVTQAARESLGEERLHHLGPKDMLQWLDNWEKTGFLPGSS